MFLRLFSNKFIAVLLGIAVKLASKFNKCLGILLGTLFEKYIGVGNVRNASDRVRPSTRINSPSPVKPFFSPRFVCQPVSLSFHLNLKTS